MRKDKETMPRPSIRLLAIAAALCVPAWAGAQLALPGGDLRGGIGGGLRDTVPDLIDTVGGTLPLDQLERLSPARLAENLLAVRTDRLASLVRRNSDSIAFDDRGQPAVRDTILVMGAGAAALEALRKAGYDPQAERIEGLDLPLTRLTVPRGQPLARAIKSVRKLAPGAEVSGDSLYFPSGAAPSASGASLASRPGSSSGALGLIDGGVAAIASLGGPIEQKGFARGAPVPSTHGTAVASLLTGSGPIRGPAPGAPLLVADVYGGDPAGGNALALARALGWMASRGVRIVTMSLVGPPNPVLNGAVRAAQGKGVTIVAAVGNDGPAAPPAYPASWPGVIAVTGVDGRDRALLEAGKSLHLDFAAPGADMFAADMKGNAARVRGTSFAAPLVAARLHGAGSLSALSREARDLGKKGPDATYGRGLICGSCRNNR
ncbi:S8 family serine peptidase [Sphingobium phenoxybenzoativorans]|uniref:S8 family serine peptidase n=2 Tax=Sphingobium phenoxybenzoativorans TaxID=1592790 RepID=A0A975K684_9SPHN|nr:S8 family serine peptidase [Sphingobium phenoxybenzoativorans]